MAHGRQEALVKEVLGRAGITIGGDSPFDMQVHDGRVYGRVVRDGVLGLGESYMDGWWDCQALDQFFDRVLRSNPPEKMGWSPGTIWHDLKPRLVNLQKRSRAYQVGEQHYDLGNDLYRAMLDKRMNYTCGYWKNATTLDEAQEAKLELVCKKIALRPGLTVLELGCGFGSFAAYAAERYGVSVRGVTVSRRQVELGNELCKGLPVELALQDYRSVSGRYDRVVSVGIMEHVGYRNYRTYMKVVDRTLKPDGIAFVHTIGGNVSTTTSNAWTTRYIFRNGMLPSIHQLGKAMEGLFVMEDWHNFGPDYDRTLLAWHRNFEDAWPVLQTNYPERFRRMWRYYLLSSAGGFRSRSTQLWQIVLTRPGSPQPACRLD
jgi:cyclopropane-fatty-acyl-phospholipid synthase